MSTFQPLAYGGWLQATATAPEGSTFTEHAPFIRLLVELLQPSTYVQLGLGSGASYLTVREAVVALGLTCACYGLESGADPEVAGAEPQQAAPPLLALHDGAFGGCSQLLFPTCTDEALAAVPDGSVDLLQLDAPSHGVQTYPALAKELAAWMPKLSQRAVVLVYDLHGQQQGFGRRRLWEELVPRYPHFLCGHGQGLGLLAVGAQVPEGLRPLLALDAQAAQRTAQLFQLLGTQGALQQQLTQHQQQLQTLLTKLQAGHAAYAQLESSLHQHQHQHQSARDHERQQQLASEAALQHKVSELTDSLHAINQCFSFRLGLLATAPLRWVKGKLSSS